MKDSLQINVDGDIESIARSIEATEAQVALATRRALNKTAMWVRTRLLREASSTTGIKQKDIRQRLRLYKATRDRLSATVWLGSGAIVVKAGALGRMRQTRTGAAVKGHFFEGAFVATMPNGHRGIYERLGRKRLPIEELEVSFQQHYSDIVRRKIDMEAMQYFEVVFERELKFVMSR